MEKQTVMDRVHKDRREFLCGWSASAVNIIVTFPINKVMFRQQMHGYRSKQAVEEIYREGVLKLYRGIAPPFLQKTLNLSIMFGMYHQYNVMLLQMQPSAHPVLVHGTSALLAGFTEALLGPFERVQTLMQDRHYHNHFRNTAHAFSHVRTYGVAEFYRGMSAVLLRNGPSNCVFFLGRESLREHLPPCHTRMGTVVTDFASGGLLGAIISTMFFPVNVVKTRMQSRLGGDFMTMREALYEILNERDGKWRKLYRGVHLNYTRSLLSWGIINAAYEISRDVLYDQR